MGEFNKKFMCVDQRALHLMVSQKEYLKQRLWPRIAEPYKSDLGLGLI